MAIYKTKKEIDEARELHGSFFILKAEDSIEENLVPSIKKIQGNAETSSIKITDGTDNETFNLHHTNCVLGPFGKSTGWKENSEKKVECVTGEVLVYFNF